VGSVSKFHGDAVGTARDLGVDFLSMPEPRLGDHSAACYLEAHYGAHILAAIRRVQYSKNGRRASPHGGALCMNLTAKQRGTSMRLLLSDPRGLLVHTMELPGFKPAALMTLYLPGHKSPQANWVPGLIAAVKTQHATLARNYGHTNVYLSTDINRRASDLGGRRFTHDAGVSRDDLVAQLCADLGISPLHGRTEATRAHVTSRCIDSSVQLHDEQGTEVDYIFGSDQLPADRFDVLPLVPFSPVGAITHRFIGAAIRLEPTEVAPASPAGGKPGGRARTPRIPDYDDVKKYQRSQAAILEGIRDPRFKALLASGTSGEVMDALEAILMGAQHGWAPEGAKQAAEAALRADPMHHVPTDGHSRVVNRLYDGKKLPRATADVFASSRTKLNRAKKLRKRAATAATLGHRARSDSLTVEWTRLRAEGRELNKQARAQARQWARQWESGVTRVWEHRRKHNAADLWRQLNKAAPTDPGTADVGGRMPSLSNEQREVFWDFYKSLYTPPDDRPALKGPTGSEWDAFIPRADGSKLGAPPTAHEIYHALYPPHTDDAPSPDTCPSGLPSCAICATEAASFEGWDGDPENTDDAPLQGPSLHTSTSCGQDGLHPEVLRFSRNSEPSARRAERLEVCAVLARAYAQWHADGEVPAAACKFRSTPLFKDGNALNPADYRFLTIGDLLQKVWCIVMVRRLTHWAVGSGILSDTQAAFIPQHGCEQHVYTLTESIRWNWARGRDASALFIDLRKAYDMVRADALYPLLRKMGVADSLVRLLESRSRQRVSRLRVDGVDGPEVHMVDGVGQGDPLSCILFNLFMEPLLRSLDALPGTSGVAVGDLPTAAGVAPRLHVRYRVLAFADDLVAPTTSPDELQLVLNHVLRWCDAWGMELGVKKTQAVHFPCPASRRATAAAGRPPRLPELSVTWRGSTSPIVWAESYRYLGFWMFGDLRLWGARAKGGVRGGRRGKLVGGMGFMDEVARRATLAYARTVQAHSLIRKAPPSLSLQVFLTAVVGCLNFLMALVEPSGKAYGPIDKLSCKVARDALRLRSNCPTVAAWAESRLMPGEAILARERSRFLLALQLSPIPSLAQRVYFSLAPLYVPAHNPGRAAPGTMWTFRMLDLQRHYANLGASPAVVSSKQLVPPHRATATLYKLVPSVLVARGLAPVLGLGLSTTAPPVHVAMAVPATVVSATHDASTPLPPPSPHRFGLVRLYCDHKRAANVFARAVALVLWRRAAAKSEATSAARTGASLAPARTSSDRPRPGPPTAHYADLILLGASAPAAHAASAGLRRSITPVSTHGPACSGAMRALVCRQSSLVNTHGLGTLIQGRSAMFHYPLAPAARMPPPRRTRASRAPSGGAARPQRAARRRRRGDSTETESSEQSVSDATSDLEASIASDDSPPPLAGPRSSSGAAGPRQPPRVRLPPPAAPPSRGAPRRPARAASGAGPPAPAPQQQDNTSDTDSSLSTRSPPASPPAAPRRGNGSQRTPPPAPPPAESPEFAAWAHEANDLGASCTLCGASPEDPFHVLVECTHPDVVAVRDGITSRPSLPRKIVRICEALLEASSVPRSSALQRQAMRNAAREALHQLSHALGVTSEGVPVPGAPALDWSSPELRFVLYRFLAVSTFSAAAAAPGHQLVRLLGSVFDRVTAKPHKLRPVANVWAGFAGTAVAGLFQAWNTAFAARRVGVG
jgi:hypothetical protein